MSASDHVRRRGMHVPEQGSTIVEPASTLRGIADGGAPPTSALPGISAPVSHGARSGVAGYGPPRVPSVTQAWQPPASSRTSGAAPPIDANTARMSSAERQHDVPGGPQAPYAPLRTPSADASLPRATSAASPALPTSSASHRSGGDDHGLSHFDEPPPGVRAVAAYGSAPPPGMSTRLAPGYTVVHTPTAGGGDSDDDSTLPSALGGSDKALPQYRNGAGVAPPVVKSTGKASVALRDDVPAEGHAYAAFRVGFDAPSTGNIAKDAWGYVTALYATSVGHASGFVSGHVRTAAAATSTGEASTLLQLMETHEAWMPLVVLLIAAFTRYYRLDVPSGVVFDETHFGRFTNQYNAGTYLFDIHPPFAKIVFWFITQLVGYDYTVCKYVNITEEYDPKCKFIYIRIVAAAFGSLTAPMFYLITRNWGGSIYAALLASALFIFDNLNLIESRLILTDSQLMFWITAALLSAQYWWARLNSHADAETHFFTRFGREYSGKPAERSTDVRFMSLREHYGWLVWMGIMCANAVAVKWTGLATPGMIAVEAFFAITFLRRPVKLHDGLVIAGVAFVVYAWYFWCHFALLPKTGDGDGFMRLEFQRTLIGNPNYDAAAVRPPFLVNFFQLNREMLSANARITQRHNWESWWWEWPLNLRGLLYYSKDAAHTFTMGIYLLGNPAVIWLVFACLLVTCACLAVYYRCRRFAGPDFASLDKWSPTLSRCTFCIITYVLNLLPYTAVTRSCFIYHYMPALMYGEICTALIIDALAGRKHMALVFRVVMFVVFAVWLFYAPWVYAWPLTNDGHARRRWLKRWD